MAVLYSASARFEASFTLPDPTLFADAAAAPYFRSYLTLRQGAPTQENWLRIVWGMRWEPGGGTPEYTSYTQYRYGSDYSTEVPAGRRLLGGGTLLEEFSSPGDDCALCGAGGLLTLEQDPDADEARFTTPLGSRTDALSALGFLNENGLYQRTLYMEWRQVAATGPVGRVRWGWHSPAVGGDGWGYLSGTSNLIGGGPVALPHVGWARFDGPEERPWLT